MKTGKGKGGNEAGDPRRIDSDDRCRARPAFVRQSRAQAVCSEAYLRFPWCWTVCTVTSRATSQGNSWIQHLISRSPSTLFTSSPILTKPPPYRLADQKTWIVLVKVICSILEDTDKLPLLPIFVCEDSRMEQVIRSWQRENWVPTRSKCDRKQAI